MALEGIDNCIEFFIELQRSFSEVRFSVMLWAKPNYVCDSIGPIVSESDDVMRFKVMPPFSH